MNLQTIEMPKAEAIRHYREYAHAVRQREDEVDRAIMRGFHALTRGERILQLSTTIAAGGVDELGRPRLAIARANSGVCLLQIEEEWRPRGEGRPIRGLHFWGEPPTWNERSTKPVSQRRVTVPVFEGLRGQTGQWVAMVPIVPPRFRPRALHTHHVLWEADWRRPRQLQAPHDPALLRHLGGDLWLLLATWDLTELERAVLAGRT